VTGTVDLVVRNGTVVDGTGGEMFEADIAVANGRIVEIGKNLSVRGREEIAAKDRIVTPGFVDVHTHYDAQATWESRLQPSSLHGITTVIMGNCGVGFAPCRPEERQLLLRLMEGVEDIPHVVLDEGVPWQWQTSPNISTSCRGGPTTSISPGTCRTRRFASMSWANVPAIGKRATTADLRQMDQILRDAMKAAPSGFGTSRTIIPSVERRSTDANAGRVGRGADGSCEGRAGGRRRLMQFVSDWDDTDRRLAEFGRIVDGRLPDQLRADANHGMPEVWRPILDWSARRMTAVRRSASRSCPGRSGCCSVMN